VKIGKIREWSPRELEDKERDFLDQMFRLKFQFSMGQTDTLKKIRDLRKDIARIKTILREREAKEPNAG
jgi:large subunit ribosomal protein L29